MLPVSREVKARARKARVKAPVRTETAKVPVKVRKGAEIGQSPKMAKAGATTLEKDQSHPTRNKVTKATRRRSANCISRESAGQAALAPGSTTHLVDSSRKVIALKVEIVCSLTISRRQQRPSRTMKKRAGHPAMKEANPNPEGARKTNGAARTDEAPLRKLLSVSNAPGELGAYQVLQSP